MRRVVRGLLARLSARTVARERADARRESIALQAALLMAAVRAGVVHCQAHPGEVAVTVVIRDGVPVAWCSTCLDLSGSTVPARRGRHLAGVTA